MKFVYRATVLATIFASAAQAQEFENLTALEERIEAALNQPAQPIDTRVKLPRCPVAAIIDQPALGAVAVRCPQLGWRLRVTLAARESIQAVSQTTKEASATPVVKRGDAVEITVTGNGFELFSEGTALQDAKQGETLRVKTPTSPAGVPARATGPGQVEISG
jgi:flagellar basal body P-ring formation protein FlgA